MGSGPLVGAAVFLNGLPTALERLRRGSYYYSALEEKQEKCSRVLDGALVLVHRHPLKAGMALKKAESPNWRQSPVGGVCASDKR
jgi:hypothetical protein